MTKRISGIELGVADCDFVAEGKSAGDVVEIMVEHLRDEHGLDMPDADTILEGNVKEDPLASVDEDVALVIERLTEKLNLEPPESPEFGGPPIASKGI